MFSFLFPYCFFCVFLALSLPAVALLLLAPPLFLAFVLSGPRCPWPWRSAFPPAPPAPGFCCFFPSSLLLLSPCAVPPWFSLALAFSCFLPAVSSALALCRPPPPPPIFLFCFFHATPPSPPRCGRYACCCPVLPCAVPRVVLWLPASCCSGLLRVFAVFCQVAFHVLLFLALFGAAACCVASSCPVLHPEVLCLPVVCFLVLFRAFLLCEVRVVPWCVGAWCCSPLCFVLCVSWGVVLCAVLVWCACVVLFVWSVLFLEPGAVMRALSFGVLRCGVALRCWMRGVLCRCALCRVLSRPVGGAAAPLVCCCVVLCWHACVVLLCCGLLRLLC